MGAAQRVVWNSRMHAVDLGVTGSVVGQGTCARGAAARVPPYTDRSRSVMMETLMTMTGAAVVVTFNVDGPARGAGQTRSTFALRRRAETEYEAVAKNATTAILSAVMAARTNAQWRSGTPVCTSSRPTTLAARWRRGARRCVETGWWSDGRAREPGGAMTGTSTRATGAHPLVMWSVGGFALLFRTRIFAARPAATG